MYLKMCNKSELLLIWEVVSVIKDRQTTIACILVLLFGFGLFFIGTDGFRAFTAE